MFQIFQLIVLKPKQKYLLKFYMLRFVKVILAKEFPIITTFKRLTEIFSLRILRKVVVESIKLRKVLLIDQGDQKI